LRGLPSVEFSALRSRVGGQNRTRHRPDGHARQAFAQGIEANDLRSFDHTHRQSIHLFLQYALGIFDLRLLFQQFRRPVAN